MPNPEQRPFTSGSFDQFLGEQKLVGSRCTACGALYLPPRALCARCHGEAMEWVETSGRGRLAAFTSIAIGTQAMNAEGYGRDNPYLSGIVELDEGVRISARILGVDAKNPGAIQIGMPLTAAFVETGPPEKRRTALAFRA